MIIRKGLGILIYSAWQGLRFFFCYFYTKTYATGGVCVVFFFMDGVGALIGAASL